MARGFAIWGALLRAPTTSRWSRSPTLVAYRRRHEKLVEARRLDKAPDVVRGTSSPSGTGSLVDNKHHVALVKGEVDGEEDVLVRVPLRMPDRRRPFTRCAATAASSSIRRSG